MSEGTQAEDQAFFDEHKQAMQEFQAWFDEHEKEAPDFPKITEAELFNLVTPEQRLLLERARQLNPVLYGFKGEFLGAGPVPPLISYEAQQYQHAGQTITHPTKYLPAKVATAFNRMAGAWKAESGRRLIVYSGYRSPAYQTGLIIYWAAHEYDYQIAPTLRRVAHPDYSQHCSATHTAVDIGNQDGDLNEDNAYTDDVRRFSGSVDYVWLQAHAAEFGFHESYGPDNQWGVDYEPWHWQFKPMP